MRSALWSLLGQRECPSGFERENCHVRYFWTPVTERQTTLLLGPYGVLGAGVIDAVAENPESGSSQLPADRGNLPGLAGPPFTSASI
jgi:hypothetical protein